MCGIVAVVGRRSLRPPPDPHEVDDRFATALQALTLQGPPDAGDLLRGLSTAIEALGGLDRLLRGVPGLTCLLANPPAVDALERGAARADALATALEAALDAGHLNVGTRQLEELNAALVRLRDVIWALGRDRLRAAKSASDLAGALGLGPAGPDLRDGPAGLDLRDPPPAALGVIWAVLVALRSLERLEVRGRDSAGLHLMLCGHGLDLASPELKALLGPRSADPRFTSLAVRAEAGCLSLVYKAAAEIGELGDNITALWHALAADRLLARALASPDVTATVIGHTRWASVGLVSEANAHPLNSDEPGRDGAPCPYAVGALNGDIDNYTELVKDKSVAVPSGVTTDAKLVPVLFSRHLAGAGTAEDAFRLSVGQFEGSVGIAANAARAPGELYLALRGCGQSLNIGLAEDGFVVASEPYGLVEETDRYLRMDGEKGGQVIVCSRSGAGTLEGLARRSYDGTELPISPGEVIQAEITTRDIDRRGFKHFLIKEISEAPLSVRKTLRGKISTGKDGMLFADLGEEVIPVPVRQALSAGRLHNIIVIGQGTAHVAGEAVAAAISKALPGLGVSAMTATDLSGWGPAGAGLPDDMSATLVVAVSQSGTTTDTNRTVDLLRARGAHIIAIVNRRNSDLVQKANGVLYTSDGRDVEMSVASTKAFYSQVTAGHLLALGLASAAGEAGPGRAGMARAHEILGALRDLPSLMEKVLANRAEIGRVASATAPSHRSWAVVGSGPDHISAAEVRIKLSELCYKAIALDSTEDKKHIDLSSEPMVIVCAASAVGPNARDIAKEIDIFRAHRAAPVVIAAEGGEGIFHPDVDVLSVPRCHPELAFVLAAMTGHLFGYEAALAIDAQARPLREARALIEGAARDAEAAGEQSGQARLSELGPSLERVVAPALAGVRSGAYDGCLNASTAARLTALLRYATGSQRVDSYEAEMGKVGAPSAIVGDLAEALGAAIDELTRPIDAIKHQAKTVTVGTSRSEEGLLSAPFVVETLRAGASVEALGYRALRTLAALGPVVEEVLGYTRYRITVPGLSGAPGSPGAALPDSSGLDAATITVLDQGGISRSMTSRTVADNRLRGTKRRAAGHREVTVFKGLHDGRTGVMVPEVEHGQVVGLTLLHVRFATLVGPLTAKAVLQAYQDRYRALVDAVTESEPAFADEVLGHVPMAELLTEPVAVLARHWSGSDPGAGAGH